MDKTLQITTIGDRELGISRAFAAPREMVFEAWTKPELVKRWLLGPPGWAMPVCEIDLRVGGTYRYVWRNADGREMAVGGRFLELIVPEKIVQTELFDEDWTGGETINTLNFIEKNGITTVAGSVRYASQAIREQVLKSGMARGIEASHARLDEVLESMQPKVGA